MRTRDVQLELARQPVLSEQMGTPDEFTFTVVKAEAIIVLTTALTLLLAWWGVKILTRRISTGKHSAVEQQMGTKESDNPDPIVEQRFHQKV